MLSRKRDEEIVIKGDIIVRVVEIRGDKVRLGIDAPTDIPVHRQEVWEAVQREKTARHVSELDRRQKIDTGPVSPAVETLPKKDEVQS